MAEHKPFEPTRSRLESARREGDFPRSQDLTTVCAFGAGLLALFATAGALAAALQQLLRAAFNRDALAAPALHLAILALAPAVASASGAILCVCLQAKGLRIASTGPRFDLLSPAANLKRILSRETVAATLKTLMLFVCIAAAMAVAARMLANAPLAGMRLPVLAISSWRASLQTCAAAICVAALFAAADYGLQTQRWRQRLRMSHAELQRDRKEQEGDPAARSRRRSLHRGLARGSLRRVKDAAFVVCNPEHLAVALQYDPPVIAVPRVLVRAADALAARVREIARAENIPLIVNAPLARALYTSAGVGDFIPPETYIAVAAIVASLHDRFSKR